MITQDEQEAIKQYGLTMSEARIFCAIMEKGFLSYKELFGLILTDENFVKIKAATDRRGHVMICNIKRKTMAPILNIRGKGYQLTKLNNS